MFALLPQDPCDVFCGERRILDGIHCVNIIDSNKLVMRYTLNMWHISELVDYSDRETDAADNDVLFSGICNDLVQYVEQRLYSEETSFEIGKCEIRRACNGKYIGISSQGTIHELSMEIILMNTKSLNGFESRLVQLATLKLNTQVEDKLAKVETEETSYNSYCRILNATVLESQIQLHIGISLSVNQFLTCALARFKEHEYIIDNTQVSVFIKTFNKSLPMSNFKMQEDGSITTCVETFLKPDPSPIELSTAHTVNLLYRILDSLCTTISFSCLIISFLVYCVYKELRNVPGINNMHLIACLFFAQGFTKFGLWVTYVPTLCSVFGFVVHYVWLATFFSMSVSAFNVFRIFVMNPMSVPTFSYKLLLKYSCFTYLVPLLIVAATSGVALILSSGVDVGYGNQMMCFINSRLASIVAFLAPIALSFIFNLFFLIRTACRLDESARAMTTPERSYIVVYIKLFTALGLTWPLIILDASLDFSVFSYFALVFSSLQGLYIFLSFMCTRHVYSLICSSIVRKRKTPEPSQS